MRHVYSTAREINMRLRTYMTIMTVCTCILFPPIALIVVLALVCAITL